MYTVSGETPRTCRRCPRTICSASASLGGTIFTAWKRRSSARSFSMVLRNSPGVVAPIHWISPRESAGFRIFAASSVPSAEPAPTSVWSSSIKTTYSSFSLSSFMIFLRRSSNWPRYFVPATISERSSERIRLFSRKLGTILSTIRCASPSTIAVLPTPASPISTGLFFVRRHRISITRSISGSRPISGSSLPWAASAVRSRVNSCRLGVFEFSLFVHRNFRRRAALPADLVSHVLQPQAQVEKYLGGDRIFLAHHAEQKMFGPDVAVF